VTLRRSVNSYGQRYIPDDLNHPEPTASPYRAVISSLVGNKDLFRGHAVAQLVEALRYKPKGSIPEGVIGIFR
jgi:hypothetical protein